MRSINRMLDRLICALGFLTILPLGRTARFDAMGMIAFFPVVGIIIGALVSSADMVFSLVFPAPVAGLLDVILLAALTGALHIDGLGDSADGIFSHRPREKALAIMKDSRVGAMGMVVVGCVLALKWSCLTGLDAHRHLIIIVVPAYARSAMIFAIGRLPYGRPDGGTGHGLFEKPLKMGDYAGLAIPVGLSLFLGWQGLLLNLAFITMTMGLIAFYRKKMGCVTGDMLGAMTEILEATLLLAVLVGV
ncbi:MAG: adenosylcobinamide-GDP ribazoletransferase [Desulfobacterales bacterium]|nr:adenosylcobinamide-GDP ribazoletransferase [Desulfobacterales bacterium]